MSMLEDRMRTAMRACADTVTPGSAPPLRLPPPRSRAALGLARRPSPGSATAPPFGNFTQRRWAGWLAPAAAALAVVAAITAMQASSLLLTSGAANRHGPAWAQGVPPHYVVLTYSNSRLGRRGDAIIRATTTGKLVKAVAPPEHGTFTAVTAAPGNEGTWVLAARLPAAPLNFPAALAAGARRAWLPAAVAERAGPLRFYRLSVGIVTAAVRLTSLPVQVQPLSAVLTGLALSPDGSRLAYSVTLGYASQVRVVSMATGKAQPWPGLPHGRLPGPGGLAGFGTLSWVADIRTFGYGTARTGFGPIRYGKLTGHAEWVYWTSPAGSPLIVVARFGNGRGLVGVLRGRRFRPLPGSNRIPVAPAPPDAVAAW